MKRTLVALAAISAASVATAQSSVTLFGVVDAAFSSYKSKSSNVLGNSATASRTVLSNSGYNASRLGFRGTEDLGGGLAASFWLEAPVTADDGQTGVSTFSRRSTVSYLGASVRFGWVVTTRHRSGTTSFSIRSAPTAWAPI